MRVPPNARAHDTCIAHTVFALISPCVLQHTHARLQPHKHAPLHAPAGKYKEAEETLLQIANDKYRNEYTYTSWLARCYIMNGKARLAWERYLQVGLGWGWGGVGAVPAGGVGVGMGFGGWVGGRGRDREGGSGWG